MTPVMSIIWIFSFPRPAHWTCPMMIKFNSLYLIIHYICSTKLTLQKHLCAVVQALIVSYIHLQFPFIPIYFVTVRKYCKLDNLEQYFLIISEVRKPKIKSIEISMSGKVPPPISRLCFLAICIHGAWKYSSGLLFKVYQYHSWLQS